MVLFAHLTRRRDHAESTASLRLPRPRTRALPRGFEPLADALMHRGDVEACAIEVARDLATDGVPLVQVLDDLETTCQAVGAGAPAYDLVRALSLAWNEVSLQYLHGLSCEDPLTGLASLPHLRSRIDELYRAAERDGDYPSSEYALVIVELGARVPTAARPAVTSAAESVSVRFSTLLAMVEVAEAMRTVFSGGETLARIAGHRVGALVPRDAALGASVEALRQLLVSWAGAPVVREAPRVWIESLPPGGELTSALLDEMAR